VIPPSIERRDRGQTVSTISVESPEKVLTSFFQKGDSFYEESVYYARFSFSGFSAHINTSGRGQ